MSCERNWKTQNSYGPVVAWREKGVRLHQLPPPLRRNLHLPRQWRLGTAGTPRQDQSCWTQPVEERESMAVT